TSCGPNMQTYCTLCVAPRDATGHHLRLSFYRHSHLQNPPLGGYSPELAEIYLEQPKNVVLEQSSR
ncbi:MAG: hypothetical protein OXN89_18815, partial [Bryobacterales bacterium]|nr:hypothetical protein [Bryobacterales bacterium]